MKNPGLLLVALCLWNVVAAQYSYKDMSARFRQDTLPCHLDSSIRFDGECPAMRGHKPGSCDLGAVFIAGDTLVTFIPSAVAADTTFRDPVYRFSGENVERLLSRTRIVTGGRMGAVDDDFPDDSDFEEIMGVVVEDQTGSWKSYAAGDCAYRLPLARSLAGIKKDPFPGPDMRQRYIYFLTEAAVVLKGGGERNFVHIVYLSLDP